MGYDDVITRMGDFGRYQRRIYFFLCLPIITCAFHKMGGVFLSAKTDFRCLLPQENPNNATFFLPPDVMNISYPPGDDETKSWSRCQRYNTDPDNRYNASDGNWSVVECDSFVYDKSQYKSTTATEWNLVCDKAWIRATGDSLFMVGMMLGSIIFGALSDKYGRRLSLIISLIIQLISGILVSIAPEIFSYMIFRLIVGSTSSGVFLVAYVIAHEMVGPKKRLVAAIGCQLFFTSGYILTTGMAYYITNWRTLQIAFTAPTFVFLAYWWLIPESARWLTTKGRLEEAKELLQKASLVNGVELTKDTLNLMLINESESKPDFEEPSFFDLVRYPNLRKKTLLLFFVWFVNSGTYYGLSWNTSNLGGNDYINFANAAMVELPANLFLLCTLDKWGRKFILCGSMLIAGASLLCTFFVPHDMPWLLVSLAMFGKLAITASYGAVYVFTSEQFPTAVRNVGLGACSTSAKIGGIIAPYINHSAEIWRPLPLVIFGTSSFISGMLTLFLPETLNKKLPESIQDGERFGRKNIIDAEKWIDIDMIKPLKEPAKIIREKENGYH